MYNIYINNIIMYVICKILFLGNSVIGNKSATLQLQLKHIKNKLLFLNSEFFIFMFKLCT